MRFLYKIYSNYDGFTPLRISQRLRDGRFLDLVWSRYLDSVQQRDECWIYFHGSHAFAPGVYIKGYLSNVDRRAGRVTLRVREQSASAPLTDDETTTRIAQIVSVRNRQVFHWPEEWSALPRCGLDDCEGRRCEKCDTWLSIPIIQPAHANAPAGITVPIASAYWIIPSRCYLYAERKKPAAWIERATHIFEEFKLGERRYSYPLALGTYYSLCAQEKVEFDAIIPIPLSPDKQRAGELHRTRELARQLGELLGVPVRESLSLSAAISKRMMQSEGYTRAQFRDRYYTIFGSTAR